MKSSRYTEEHIIGAIKQHESEVKTRNISRELVTIPLNWYQSQGEFFKLLSSQIQPVAGNQASCAAGLRCNPVSKLQ